MTSPPPASAVLVCVYYLVERARLAQAIAQVRDIQRRLVADHPGLAAEVLVRSSTGAGMPAAHADDPATVMETYRCGAVRALAMSELLAALDQAALPLAALRHGPRHVEVFEPCAS